MDSISKNTSSIYRALLKEKIISTATTCFHSQGIKAVKMDDIAHRLSISKRTLYELFHNKEELLLACIKSGRERFTKHLEELMRQGANTMDVFMDIITTQMDDTHRINPLFFAEMDKYPSVVNYLEKTRAEQHANSQEFFIKGVKEGYFRDDVNFDIVLEISNSCVEHVMKSAMYDRFPLYEIHHTVTIVFVRGLCTEKGVKCIDDTLRRVEK